MRTIKKLVFGLAAIFASVQVLADQPVHCLRTQVEGEWTIYVDQTEFQPNLFQAKQICQHNVPNKVQIYDREHNFQFQSEPDEIQVTLHPDQKTDWSMIYDQGMVVNKLPGPGKKRFTANFKYYAKKTVRKELYPKLTSGDYFKFDSVCSETMIGFVESFLTEGQTTFQCAYAKQTKQFNTLKATGVTSDVAYVQDVPVQTNPGRNVGTTLAQRKAQSDYINSLNLSWQSTTYDSLSTDTEISLAQVYKKKEFKPTPEALQEARKYLGNPAAIKLEDLPHQFSWENVSGVDFTSEPRDQKNCGSCFMVATIGMLESRLRVW